MKESNCFQWCKHHIVYYITTFCTRVTMDCSYISDMHLQYVYVTTKSHNTLRYLWSCSLTVWSCDVVKCLRSSVVLWYTQKNMLDFVFAVDDPVTWHTMNLLQNRKHYSILKLLGPTVISSIQNDHGASVYYNTLVPVDGRVNDYILINLNTSVGLFLVFSMCAPSMCPALTTDTELLT